MCKARPGPRCSDDGRKRLNKAEKNFEKRQQEAQKYIDDEKPVHEKVAHRLRDAELRLEQAKRVYYATPQGQKGLAEEITSLRDSLPKRKPSPSKKGALKLWREKNDRIDRLENLLSEGIARRANSTRDYNEFIAERPVLRQEAINRGAEISPTAQRNKSGIDYTTGKPAKVSLGELTDTQLARADSWVETGADSPWDKRPDIRAPKKIDGENIGEKATDSISKITRLSMPDGSVVEGRHDLHITKNDDEKYVLSMRTTVAASFEDASPVDKNTQELGHMLKNTRGKDNVVKLAEFSSLHAAQTRRGMIANNSSNLPDDERIDFNATIAQSGRDLTIFRFGNVSKKKGIDSSINPQNRGWVVPTHRYQETDESQSTKELKKLREKQQRAYDKAMSKAREKSQENLVTS